MVLDIGLFLSLLCLAVPGVLCDAVEAMPVYTPDQFQRAVREGVDHVIVSEHLDMTATPRFSEDTVMDSAMVAIVPNINSADLSQTWSIRVCSCAVPVPCIVCAMRCRGSPPGQSVLIQGSGVFDQTVRHGHFVVDKQCLETVPTCQLGS